MNRREFIATLVGLPLLPQAMSKARLLKAAQAPNAFMEDAQLPQAMANKAGCIKWRHYEPFRLR